jgi:hypothetical protein
MGLGFMPGAKAETGNPGMGPIPPLVNMLRADIFSKFRSQGNRPPWPRLSPKNFKTNNPAGVAGALGWGRRGIAPDRDGASGPLAAPLPLGAPFAGRGRAVSGPVRRGFIFPGGGSGGASQGAGVPGGRVRSRERRRHRVVIS